MLLRFGFQFNSIQFNSNISLLLYRTTTIYKWTVFSLKMGVAVCIMQCQDNINFVPGVHYVWSTTWLEIILCELFFWYCFWRHKWSFNYWKPCSVLSRTLCLNRKLSIQILYRDTYWSNFFFFVTKHTKNLKTYKLGK